MKKITLMFCMALFVGTTYAQTTPVASASEAGITSVEITDTQSTIQNRAVIVQMEDFEAGAIPAGWSESNDGPGVTMWTFGSNFMPGGPDFATNAAVFDDDAAGGGELNVGRLLSPPVDVSGYTTLEVSFEYSMQAFVDSGTLDVEVWDGATWNSILFVDVDTPPTVFAPMDVLAFANAAFQVRFTYDDEGDFAWGAGVDNFLLDGTPGGGGACGATSFSNSSPNANGVPSQFFPDFAGGADAADDFIVPLAPSMSATICEMSVIGTTSGTGLASDPGSFITLDIYEDAGGMPGTLIYSEDFDGATTDPGNTGDFTLSPTGTMALTGGDTYWASVVVNMNFGGGAIGQWFWSNANDGNGNETNWQDPTNLFGTNTCATWSPAYTTCGVGGGVPGGATDLLMDLTFFELPDNDICVDAFPIVCGDVVMGDTTPNTDTGGNTSRDEYYTFTGTGSPQFVTLSTCNNANYDTLLRVFEDCTLANEIATNDDGPGCAGFTSELSFLSDGTSTYIIMVEGFNAAAFGEYTLTVTCNDVAANDQCDDAIALTCGTVTAGSTTFATNDSAIAANCVDTFDPTPFNPTVDVTAPGVWYTYTDPLAGLVSDIRLTMCDDATFDTKISVYEGGCGALTCVAANDDDDDCTGFTSTVEFQTDGVSTYYILVHGFGTQTGDFNLSLECTPVPPPNDMIANSIDVDEIGLPYTDPGVVMPAATEEAGTPAGCDNAGVIGVWYNFVPVFNGEARAEVITPSGFTSVTFYDAPSESAIETELTLIDYFDNQCVPSIDASVPVVAGQAYYVYVANTTGITDIVIDGDFLLGSEENIIEGFNYYPNPAGGTLNLSAVDNIEDVAIYNILGQEVLTQDVNAVNTELNVSSLTTGAYIMKVTVGGQVGTYKILKK